MHNFRIAGSFCRTLVLAFLFCPALFAEPQNDATVLNAEDTNLHQNHLKTSAPTDCPVPEIRLWGPAVFCKGGSVKLTASAEGGQGKVTVSTFAGNKIQGYADGQGKNASFAFPSAIAFDRAGNLFVTDFDNNKIRKITPDGTVSTYAGSTAGYENGNAQMAKFNGPNGICIDRQGNVYVSERDNHCIRKITPAGVVSTLAGNGTLGFLDGDGAGARFNMPRGIECDSAGNIYVADLENRMIRKISPFGHVTTIATSSNVIGHPSDVALDKAGNVYFMNSYLERVCKVGVNGDVIPVAGGFRNPGIDYLVRNVDSTALLSVFGAQCSLEFADDGSLYVADSYTFTIRKITYPGEARSMVTTVAGMGITGFADGAADTALFFHPKSIAADAAGNIFVADGGNNRIRKIVTGAKPYTYIWSDGSTGAEKTVYDSGVYSVRTVSGGCTSAISGSVEIKVVPVLNTPSITASGQTFFCADGIVDLTASTAPGYLWSNGAVTRTIRVNIGGLYSVKAVNGACTSSASQIIPVAMNQPPKPIIRLSGLGAFCTGQKLILTAPDSEDEGLLVRNFAGSKKGYKDGKIADAQFSNPGSLAVDKEGNIYVADSGNVCIRKIWTNGTVSTVAGSRTFMKNHLKQVSQYQFAIDSSGIIYFPLNSGSIGKISIAGIADTVKFLNRFRSWSDEPQTWDVPEVNVLTFDNQQRMYTGSRYGVPLFKILADSILNSTVTTRNDIPLNLNNAPNSRYKDVYGLGYDSYSDNIIVNDGTEINHFYKISRQGQLTEFAGFGLPGFEDGPATTAKFKNALGIAINAFGDVFVADAGNYRIRKISAEGIVSTVAGTGIKGSEDGPVNKATFNNPRYIAADNAGNIYVTDPVNNRIRIITTGLPVKHYLWSTGDTTQSITVNTPGTYTVQTIASGCTSLPSDPINVAVYQYPKKPVITGPALLCDDSPVTYSVPAGDYPAGTTFKWYLRNGTLLSGIGSPNPVLRPNSGPDTAFLKLVVTNPGNCSNTDSIRIAINPYFSHPEIRGNKTNYCITDTVELTAPVSANEPDVKYSWTINSGMNVINRGTISRFSFLAAPGTDTVLVTFEKSVGGCKLTALAHISFLPCPDVSWPNVITPNTDGKNDRFEIRNLPPNTYPDLRIFNRWGQLVLDAPSYNNFWNGGNHPAGIYYFQFSYTDKTGRTINQNGWLDLIR
ncbi:MAG: gliding motility-associated C-terminal domain-containing protein [Bacteroidota bacterium]